MNEPWKVNAFFRTSSLADRILNFCYTAGILPDCFRTGNTQHANIFLVNSAWSNESVDALVSRKNSLLPQNWKALTMNNSRYLRH